MYNEKDLLLQLTLNISTLHWGQSKKNNNNPGSLLWWPSPGAEEPGLASRRNWCWVGCCWASCIRGAHRASQLGTGPGDLAELDSVLRRQFGPTEFSAHSQRLTPWGWRVCRVSGEMTRVRPLPSRSSQSSCVQVQVIDPQLDCKLLEGSHHFKHSCPSSTKGTRFL